MLILPGPFRLELNGELYGRYPTLQMVLNAIRGRLNQGGNPGLFQAFDARGGLVIEHTGLALRILTPKPRTTAHSTSKPCPKLIKVS